MGKSKYGVRCRLVWDGGDQILIPAEMGEPASDQMIGTWAERLSELGGRICYDSLGKGRSSAEYHRHIHEVRHYSVYEHPHITVALTESGALDISPAVFLNRPGVYVGLPDTGDGLRVTFNPRALLEWDQWGWEDAPEKTFLQYHAENHWPQIMPRVPRGQSELELCHSHSAMASPDHEEEKWVTVFMSGSRGFSHELVRHGDFTAISQRSTRFVDEDGSPWVDHPLVQEYLSAGDVAVPFKEELETAVLDTKRVSRKAYALVASRLQGWLLGKGVDKFTARKQARGAARGYLGNALETEIVFSASVGQWKRMMRMRCCGPADAEIRAVFAEALPELLKSRHAQDFSGFRLEDSKDGIGRVAVEEREACAK